MSWLDSDGYIMETHLVFVFFVSSKLLHGASQRKILLGNLYAFLPFQLIYGFFCIVLVFIYFADASQ